MRQKRNYRTEKDGEKMEKEAKKTRKISEARRRATLKYQAKRARITLDIFPEEKEMIKEAAKKNNKTIARYICELVKKDIEKDEVKTMEKYWYAILENDNDLDWGYGSFDYEEAEGKAIAMNAYSIAIIDANYDESGNATCDPVCVGERYPKKDENGNITMYI